MQHACTRVCGNSSCRCTRRNSGDPCAAAPHLPPYTPANTHPVLATVTCPFCGACLFAWHCCIHSAALCLSHTANMGSLNACQLLTSTGSDLVHTTFCRDCSQALQPFVFVLLTRGLHAPCELRWVPPCPWVCPLLVWYARYRQLVRPCCILVCWGGRGSILSAVLSLCSLDLALCPGELAGCAR